MAEGYPTPLGTSKFFTNTMVTKHKDSKRYVPMVEKSLRRKNLKKLGCSWLKWPEIDWGAFFILRQPVAATTI